MSPKAELGQFTHICLEPLSFIANKKLKLPTRGGELQFNAVIDLQKPQRAYYQGTPSTTWGRKRETLGM